MIHLTFYFRFAFTAYNTFSLKQRAAPNVGKWTETELSVTGEREGGRERPSKTERDRESERCNTCS